MKRTIGGLLVCAVALAPFVACSSDKDDTKTDGGGESGGGSSTGGKDNSGGSSSGGKASGSGGSENTGGTDATDAGDGSTGTGDDGGGDGGGTVVLPQAVLCPEKNPFSPKNANSVNIDDTVLKADAHWTADKVYLIGDDFKIENHTLTVDAGTTICLYQKGKILVGQGIDPGEIHLNGTAEKPIVITSNPSTSDETKPDVYNGGIQFDTYMNSSISYVNIWYAGRGGGSASWGLELTNTAQGTDKNKPLLVDHVTIGHVQSSGVRVGTLKGLAEGSAVRFTGYDAQESGFPPLNAVAEVDIRAAKSFNEAFDYSGASIPDEAKHVNLKVNSDESLDSDAELTSIGLPYLYKNHQKLHIHGLQSPAPAATLTIREGVTLQMSGALIVGALSGTAEGDLVVAGTAAKPVTFTSLEETPAAGDWEGFYFVGGQYDPAKTKMDHANILYAGVDASDGLEVNNHIGRCGSFDTAAIMITSSSSSAPYPGPSLTNIHISHSAWYGIASDASNSGGKLSNDYNKPDIVIDDTVKAKLAIGACTP